MWLYDDSEWWIGKDLEAGNHDVFQDIISAFTTKDLTQDKQKPDQYFAYHSNAVMLHQRDC
jgi:hypothetical protein